MVGSPIEAQRRLATPSSVGPDALNQPAGHNGRSLQSFTMKPAVKYRGGNNGRSNQCASAASRRAASGTVARGEVGSSNFKDRVVERFGSIPQVGPLNPNRIGSFAEENGAGAASALGKSAEWIAANDGSAGLGSCKAHHVGVSPQEDRGGTAGAVGKGAGGEEEGGLEQHVRAVQTRVVVVIIFSYDGHFNHLLPLPFPPTDAAN
jgi:hypothetical protein